MILLGLVLALLVAQPDLGQTMLVLGTWGVMFFMAGMPWLWIIALGAAGVGGAFAAYTMLPARRRPHRPLPDRRGRHVPGRHGPRGADPWRLVRASGRARARSSASSPTAMPTSSSRSPARSSASCSASSSCCIFAFIVLRGLTIALKEKDDFTRYAVAGLVIVFGFQSIINMARQSAADAGQGHDAAVHLLWRLVADRHRHLDGHGAGADAQAAGEAHADRASAVAAQAVPAE